MLNLQIDPSTPLRINGLYPVIINITPVTNLPLLLGLSGDDIPEPVDSPLSQKYPQAARGILRGKEEISGIPMRWLA